MKQRFVFPINPSYITKLSVASRHTAAQTAPERWEENIYNSNLIHFNGTVEMGNLSPFV